MYAEKGVGIQVANAVELEGVIKMVSRGEISINTKAYNAFIKEVAYKIDGKAVERTLEYITSCPLTPPSFAPQTKG